MGHFKNSTNRDDVLKQARKEGVHTIEDAVILRKFGLESELDLNTTMEILKSTQKIKAKVSRRLAKLLKNHINSLSKEQIPMHIFKKATLNVKPINWLIKGVMQKNELGLIFGPSGERKSFVTLDMALHASNGIEWQGHRVKSKVTVLYLAGEGFQGISNRLIAASKYHNLPIDNIFISELPGDLLDTDSVDRIASAIESFNEPVWLIVDTLHRNFGNGDENSARDMGKMLSNIDHKLRSTGATVTLVHHTGHGNQNRERGSSSLMGALDSKISVSTDKHLVTTVSCGKMKDGEAFKTIVLESKVVILGEDEDNDLITSLAMVSSDKTPDETVNPDEEIAASVYDILPLDSEMIVPHIACTFNKLEGTAKNIKTRIKKILIEKYPDFQASRTEWTKQSNIAVVPQQPRTYTN